MTPFHKPSLVVVIYAVAISIAASPLASTVTPEIRIRAHFVGMNALSDQLDLSHHCVEALLQDSDSLTHQIVRIRELVVMQ